MSLLLKLFATQILAGTETETPSPQHDELKQFVAVKEKIKEANAESVQRKKAGVNHGADVAPVLAKGNVPSDALSVQLETLRLRRRYAQEEMAKIFGVTAEVYDRWEKVACPTSKKKRFMIALAISDFDGYLEAKGFQ